MKNKKKALARTVVVLCLCVLCMTIAALVVSTNQNKTRNVITTGAVDIDLLEYREEGATIVPWNPNDRVAVMPGSTVSKIVRIENLDAAAYVRARFEVKVTDADGNATTMPEGAVTFDAAGTGWEQKGDGSDWWYYNEVLDAAGSSVEHDSTTALFNTVSFDLHKITNEYQGSTVNVIVYAEAVQAANMNVNNATEIADNIWHNEKEPGGGT